jgi:hypothetical protein
MAGTHSSMVHPLRFLLEAGVMKAQQLPMLHSLYSMLIERGARHVRNYVRGETHIIYTEEPFGGLDVYGTHISISAGGRNPTWEEQRDAVWELCPGITMASYIVPPSQHGTLGDSHVFHWFEVLPLTGYVERLGDWL